MANLVFYHPQITPSRRRLLTPPAAGFDDRRPLILRAYFKVW